MDINLKSVHFDASQRLQDHIQKKLDRMSRRYDPAARAEVTLKVVKPETAMNKEASIRMIVAGAGELFASKTADTFEEAFDTAAEAIARQLEKTKHAKV